MTTVRILADDLTGALDSAAGFTGQVPVYIGCPPKNGGAQAGVAVLATATRDIPANDLPRHLKPVLAWLKAGDIAFKKVDSQLRGNTFCEVAWLVHAGGFSATVFAPAFPAQGRVTINGQQWVIEPGNPYGPRAAAAVAFATAFGSLGLRIDATADERVNPLPIWAPDAVTDHQLDAIVAAFGRDDGRSRLWCGSAGLAHALARSLGLVPPAGQPASPLPIENQGPTVLISASQHPVLREQWALLCATLTARAQVRHAHAEQMRAAIALTQRGADSAWFELAQEEPMSAERAELLLAMQTAHLVSGLPKPGQLIVVGGDTLLGLCRTARVEAMLTGPSLRNGWGCARLKGGPWDGVPIYSRSGAFGGKDDLLEMVRALGGSERA